jgi:hypothetical protein
MCATCELIAYNQTIHCNFKFVGDELYIGTDVGNPKSVKDVNAMRENLQPLFRDLIKQYPLKVNEDWERATKDGLQVYVLRHTKNIYCMTVSVIGKELICF